MTRLLIALALTFSPLTAQADTRENVKTILAYVLPAQDSCMEWVTGNVGAFLLTTRACAVKIEKEPHLLLIRRISVIDPPRADGGQHFEICTVRFIDRPDRAAMMHLSWCRTQKVSDQFTESVMQDGFTQTLNEIMRRITGANVVGDKRL